MRNLKSQLEAYRELMNKSNRHWQEAVKVMKKYNFYMGIRMSGTSRGCRNRLYT